MLHVRYDGFGQDVTGLKVEVAAVDDVVCGEPERSVCSLIDVRGTVASIEGVAALKRSATRTEPYADKVAVVGVTGVRRILLDSVIRISGMNLRACGDDAAAKAWLSRRPSPRGIACMFVCAGLVGVGVICWITRGSTLGQYLAVLACFGQFLPLTGALRTATGKGSPLR